MRIEEVHAKLRQMEERLEHYGKLILAHEDRLRDLEAAKDYVIHRPKIRIPKFPQVLRDMGLRPPSERTA